MHPERREKYDIQSQSNRNIYTCNDSSMHNIISTVRDVGGILELFAVKEQQPRRKIGGWKRDLSKQAKKEWYLKHRTGTSMWQSEEDEWEM